MRTRIVVVMIGVLLAVGTAGPWSRLQASAGCPHVVAGGTGNTATPAVNCPTVSGGQDNNATNNYSTIGGGYTNLASGAQAVVSGGSTNQATGGNAAIGGGGGNIADGYVSTIGGGEGNQAKTSHATIGGGYANIITDDYGTIGGGNQNQAGNNTGATTDADYATVGGGYTNAAVNIYATVGGGHSNAATGSFATVGGGLGNVAIGGDATLSGGRANTAGGARATVGGGYLNRAMGSGATVSGGSHNEAMATYATIAGGGQSDLGNTSSGNRVTDDYGTVGGGGNNQAGNGTTSLTDRRYATVAGGLSNTASGAYGAILGGRENIASGSYAAVAGGFENTASGSYSFAAGRQAKANQHGSFVWGDNTAANISPTAANQFIARASGGVTFYSNAAATTGVNLPAGGGGWSNLSDRSTKANFAAADSASILERVAALPIQLWNYKSQDASVKHIGPMAQDFAAAFGVGEDNRHISTVDADGVALAAIQGLYAAGLEKDQAIAALQQENTMLQGRMAAIEATQHGGSTARAVVSPGLTLSWSVIALGGLLVLVLAIVSSVSLTLLFLRRRTTVA